MAKTPEGTVKADIKKLLDAEGSDLYYFMPVQSGFGKRGLDFFGCYKGRFIAIEVKRPGGKSTVKRFQSVLAMDIMKAGGFAIITDKVEDVATLLTYIERTYG